MLCHAAQQRSAVADRQRGRETDLRIFLNLSPAGVNSTLIPPDRVSPAAMDTGLSASEAPSRSIISAAAW